MAADKFMPYLEARKAMDKQIEILRDQVLDKINLSTAPSKNAKAAAWCKIIIQEWGRAIASLASGVLPHDRRTRKTDVVNTLNPDGKVRLRDSHIRHPGARYERHVGKPYKGRIRSHHKGTYARITVPTGRPRKYFTLQAALEGAARKRKLSYIRARRRAGKHYKPRDKPDMILKRKEYRAALKTARASARSTMRLEKIGSTIGGLIGRRLGLAPGRIRNNGHPEYSYGAPHPRMRRTSEQVERWGYRRKPHSASRRTESKFWRIGRKVWEAAQSGAKKTAHLKALNEGRNAWWKRFHHHVWVNLGSPMGRRPTAHNLRRR